MRCPYCGSTNVRCIDTVQVHAHECNRCGVCDVYRGTTEPSLPMYEADHDVREL